MNTRSAHRSAEGDAMTAADDHFQRECKTYLSRNFAESGEWFTKALAENSENVNY